MSSIIWRYGKMPNGSDFTELDQWISDKYLKQDAPGAPAALTEAIENWLKQPIFTYTPWRPHNRTLEDKAGESMSDFERDYPF